MCVCVRETSLSVGPLLLVSLSVHERLQYVRVNTSARWQGSDYQVC